MKKMKKVVALVVAAAMTMALSLAAFATGGTTNPGSITVTNANVGSTYKAYKIFDLSGSDVSDPKDGVFDNFAYTYTKTGTTDDAFTALTADSSPFTLTESSVAGKYNVALKDGKTAENIAAWLASDYNATQKVEDLFTLKATEVAEAPADTTKTPTVEFTNLELGYYFVTSSLGKDYKDPKPEGYNGHGANVTLTSTKPSVDIIDKNSGPTWDNDPDDPDPDPDDPKDDPTDHGKMIVNADGTKTKKNSAKFGDVLKFNVAIDTTNYVGKDQVLNYFVSDTICDGFKYTINDDNPFEVKVDGTALDLESNEYIINWFSKNDQNQLVPETDPTKAIAFSISIPWATADATTQGKYNSIYKTPAKIDVNYSVTVVDEAAIGQAGNDNTATFDYRTTKDDPTDPQNPNDPPKPSDNGYHKSTPSTTKTYVFALGILKVDPMTGAKLQGAKFVVQDKNGKYVTIHTDKDENKTIVLSTTKPTEADANQGVFTTDENGQILIKGVAEGEYTFTEIEAPAGYNLLTKSVTKEATMAKMTEYTTTYTTYYDKDGKVVDTEQADGHTVTSTYDVDTAELLVENLSGPELPTTGGIGTVIFYVVGAILVIGAGVLLITKKRMEA